MDLIDNPKMLNLLKKTFSRMLAPQRDGLQILFEQAPFGVATVELHTGIIRSVNDKLAQRLGRSVQALRQVAWSTLAQPVSRLGQTEAGNFFTDAQPVTGSWVYRLLQADPVPVFVEISVLATLTDRRARPVCVVIVKDISEQILAQEQLRVSEQRLRLLADNARDVVWTMSPLGAVTYVSPAVEPLRGITPEQAMAQTIDETLTPDSRDRVLQYFHEVVTAVQQGQLPPQFRGELEYWRQDGSRFWTEVLAFPLMGDHGSLVEILGVTRDISQRRLYEDSLLEARERAEKSNAAKSEFLAHISHEIRTPMSAILALTDLALNTPLNDEQRVWLQKSKSAGRLLLGIINDLLDFSKMERGQLTLARQPMDLREVLQLVGDLVSEACSRKGLHYTAEIAPDVSVHRLGDAQRLAQVLLNLVSNAVKFTEHGHVRVSVRAADAHDGLRLEVQDSGIGLDAHLQARVFDGFVQGDNAQTRAHGGTGLGLSICKRLAGQMGGEVGVVSQPGQGATFWVTVRLPQVDPVAWVAAPVPGQTPDLIRGLRVLLAEDNASMRDILRQLLVLAGAQVEVAENGQVAVQKVNAAHYDLVLMDIQMPVLGGLEATRLLRQNPAHQQLPIVALTAAGFSEDRDRCLAAGMNDYLLKPFEYKDLVAALQRNVPALQAKA